jgi:hypothetical protein
MEMSHAVGLVLIGAMSLAACADDPRPARRATALDVAGDWRQQHDDGGGPATLHIDNEVGVVDVVAVLDDRMVGPAEAGVLARLPSAERRDALAVQLSLGAGRDVVREETDGGENVSFDGGVTTTVQVRSAPVPITASSSEAQDATLAWALRLDGDGAGLVGTLAVLVSERVPRVGDVNGFARTTTRIDLPLRFVREEE